MKKILTRIASLAVAILACSFAANALEVKQPTQDEIDAIAPGYHLATSFGTPLYWDGIYISDTALKRATGTHTDVLKVFWGTYGVAFSNPTDCTMTLPATLPKGRNYKVAYMVYAAELNTIWVSGLGDQNIYPTVKGSVNFQGKPENNCTGWQAGDKEVNLTKSVTEIYLNVKVTSENPSAVYAIAILEQDEQEPDEPGTFRTLAALNEAGLAPGDSFTFKGEVTVNGFAMPDDGYSEFTQYYAFVQDATGSAQLRVPADVDIMYSAGDKISGFEGKYIPFVCSLYDWENDLDYDVVVPAYQMTTFPAATAGTPYAPEEVKEISETMVGRYVKAANQSLDNYGEACSINVPGQEPWSLYGFGVNLAEAVPAAENWLDAVTHYDIEGFVGGDLDWGYAFYLSKAEALKTTDEVYLAEGSLKFEESTSVVLGCDAVSSDVEPTMIFWRYYGELDYGEEEGTRDGEPEFEQYDGEPILIDTSCKIEAYAHTLGYLPGDVQTFIFEKQNNVGINGIDADRDVKVYNLQGIEVSAEQLPAGLYIKNGKKVVIRK